MSRRTDAKAQRSAALRLCVETRHEREGAPRRRCADRRRRAGGTVGGAQARPASEIRREVAYRGPARESRRARRAPAVGCGARSARPRRARPRLRGQRRAAGVEGARRPHLLPHAVREDRVSFHAPTPAQSRPLHHFAATVRQMAVGVGGSGRHRHVFGLRRDRAPHGRASRRRRPHRRPRHRPPWRHARQFRARC